MSLDVASRARRRIALRLMPFLFLLYIIAFLDRTNISTAVLEMPGELGFSDSVIGLGSGIFFIGYLLLEVPGALLVERWSARRWIARIMVSWGLVTATMALIRTPHQFYTVRFLLGAAEAGFFPGVIVYLTHWFTSDDRAKAVGYFMAAIPISQVVGSPISGWLLGVHWFGLSGWRWLFILEAIPAIIFGVITFFYLTDWPHQAKWLPADEREWITDQLEKEKLTKKFARSCTIRQALCQRDVITLTFVYFVQATAAFSFVFWLPTMVKRLSGLPNFTVSVLAALPFVAAFIAMQANGWHSDRTRERRWHSAIPLLVSAACLLPVIFSNSGTVGSVVSFTFVVGSLMAFVPSFWAMPTALLSESAAAAAIGTINSVAMLGGFAGPSLMGYLVMRTHSFKPAFACLLVAMVIAGCLTLTVRVDTPDRVAANS
jgi:ACS family tartrate transporter-like MFS transporter